MCLRAEVTSKQKTNKKKFTPEFSEGILKESHHLSSFQLVRYFTIQMSCELTSNCLCLAKLAKDTETHLLWVAFLGHTLLKGGVASSDHFQVKWKGGKCSWLSSSGESGHLSVREIEGGLK